MVGSKVPEEDETWAVLMDLKEIEQLVLSPSFTEESIQYMQTKISDHRLQVFRQCFGTLSFDPNIITLSTTQN